MKKQLQRCKTKFDKLDSGKRGKLDQKSVVSLAKTMFAVYHPGGEPLT